MGDIDFFGELAFFSGDQVGEQRFVFFAVVCLISEPLGLRGVGGKVDPTDDAVPAVERFDAVWLGLVGCV